MGRFSHAVRRVITLQKLVAFADQLEDLDTPPGDRLYAAVQMAMYFRDESEDVPEQLRALRREVAEQGLEEAVAQELLSIGERFYDWLTPAQIGRHETWFLYVLSAMLLWVWAYTLADYRNARGQQYGPRGAGDSLGASLDADFLDTWGGFSLYRVSQAGGAQARRWVTSMFLHEGLLHLLSNLLMLMAFSVQIERRYGSSRIAAIAVLSGIGGNMFTAVLEDPCIVTIGASGLIFGTAGLWVGDLLVNFQFLKHVMARTVLTLAFLGFTLVSVLTQKHVSSYSHIGGFLTGLAPSFMVLPRFGKRRLEAWLPWVGLGITCLIFTILPLVALVGRAPGVQCPVFPV